MITPESPSQRGGGLPPQPLPRRLRALARRGARLVGLEHAARTLYNRIAAGTRTMDVQLSGSGYRFATPTFAIAEELSSLSETDVMNLFVASLCPRDAVWDIGASYGLYTLPLATRVGTGGTVIAFEPEARSRALLERNLSLNGITNVTVIGCALGRDDGPASLYRSRSATIGAHSLIRRTDYRVARRGITIDVRSADSLAATGTLQAPSAVKIDVEGSELSVLEGMTKLLGEERLRVVLVEVHPEILALLGRDPSEISATLQRHGFTNLTVIDRGRQFHLLARRGAP